MIDFKTITLEDKEWINSILTKNEVMACGYTFGNIFIWRKVYDTKVANLNGFLVISYKDKQGMAFAYPVGEGDIKPIIDALIDHCNETDIPLVFLSMSKEQTEHLGTLYPDKFECKYDRNSSDYVYLREDLANLGGKKYHGKRNHIKRFKDNNWSFEPLTTDNLSECIDMNKRWCFLNNCDDDEEKRIESCVAKRSLKYFNELDFFGCLLRVDSNVVAYTIAERLNSNTVVVHIEKAFSTIQGAYPAINQEFVLHMAKDYTYVNREEDVGVEGLRKAKLSYNPVFLVEKYSASYIK